MNRHIHESNLIEGFDDPLMDADSEDAWHHLTFLRSLLTLNSKGDFVDVDIKENDILGVHKTITQHQKDMPESDKGNYRQCAVMVGGRVCPRPYMVKELMNNWILDMNGHWQTLDPKKMHIRFEKIHPFVDGNGRVGRLLMWWHEVKQGREPMLILNAEKQDYYKWFV